MPDPGSEFLKPSPEALRGAPSLAPPPPLKRSHATEIEYKFVVVAPDGRVLWEDRGTEGRRDAGTCYYY